MEATPTQRLAAQLLGSDLRDFVLSRKPDTSWRMIARELASATGGEVDVTPETLRNWYGQDAKALERAAVA